MEQCEKINPAIAKIIREKSETEQLVRFEEILAELTKQSLLRSDTSDLEFNLEAALTQATIDYDDLKEISAKNGIPHYYSSRSLSDTYASILMRKEENSLIAEIVRENSKIYPRPIPMDIFKESPFDLTDEELLDCLAKMSEQAEYQDIAQTTTSVGTIFLFSSQHLDPVYASTLAEWLDVGQVNNP